MLTASLLWIDIVILWCLVEYGLLGIDFSTMGLRVLMEQAGLWAPLASVGLMAAHSFLPFPAEIIAVANGIVFGPWIGVVVTWLGAMLGATLSYEVARGLGPAARERFVPSRYRTRLDAFSINIGIAPLLVSRMLPIVSFNLINYAAGLAGVPRLTFLWTTGLGILPLTVLSVVLGSQALELPVYAWILASVALVVIFAAVHMATRLRARGHETGRSAAAVRGRSPGQSTR
ncbi:TVP38/TMEM64 family protein [Salinisphaera aquimarina]